MTTLPRNVSALNWGWGRSCTADAAVPRPLDDQGYDGEELKRFEPTFELEYRQAASQLSPRATAQSDGLGNGGVAGRCGLRRARSVPWGDHQCGVAADGGRLHVRHRLSLLLEVP